MPQFEKVGKEKAPKFYIFLLPSFLLTKSKQKARLRLFRNGLCLQSEKYIQYAISMSYSSFGSFRLFDDTDFLELLGKHKSETFSEMLLRLIDESGEKNSTIYTRANIDRRHFSKIVNHKGYKPSKQTVLAFAIALKLDFDKTQKLLTSAGYTLNKSILSDLIVSFFIEYKIFNVNLVNQALYKYDQPLLGS